MSKNEKITENIVRKKLESLGYYKNSDILVEEQIIQNPFIKKLLPSKNKIGKGKGKPEFLISNSENSDYLIVVECKADTKYHESKNRDQHAGYAVDGVLLYASCLSRGYNVIAVAVSGQNEKELKIDTFLHPKGAQVATPLKDTSEKPVLVKEIVLWKDYIRYAQYDENLAISRKNDLSRFSRELHNYLRDYGKITVAQMPLLVSGVLIALMEKGFKVAYPKYEGPELAQKTFQALKDEINKARLGVNQEEKKKAIINAFSFIEYHPELQKIDKKKNESPLAHIVREIDSEMKPFTQDHFDFDIIGNFYGEFIRYTGGDAQGLGIVLTPKHITELFADLAKLNKNSVVLDTCCGTAGFLISAMNKMIDGVGEIERTRILENSLIGVEQEPSMFALAVSNMILRGDGKTNLYQGSCFDDEIIDQIKNKATVGFMNPPYAQQGENLHEWNFVIQLLDTLQKNAIGVVIVPMGLAVSKHPLREQLLKEHRLESVMSMPDDLFYPVGVVSCIMVFTAHVPHDSDQHYESWFGYWKNDGHKKVKKDGRVATPIWSEIKKKWLIDYTNRKDIPGLCVRKKVGINDEWCAEAYLETDYSSMKKEEFDLEVRKYLSFLVKNNEKLDL
jgi:type I restriction-modification system DNA methylase subunit